MPVEILEEDPPEKRRNPGRVEDVTPRTCRHCAVGNCYRCVVSWCLCSQEDHEDPFP